jgi:hypothetical protein
MLIDLLRLGSGPMDSIAEPAPRTLN